MLTNKAAVALTRALLNELYKTMDAKSEAERAAIASMLLGGIAGECTILLGGLETAAMLSVLADSATAVANRQQPAVFNA